MKTKIIGVVLFTILICLGQACGKQNNLQEKAKLSIESVVLDTLKYSESYEFISISEPEAFGKDNIVHRIKMAKDGLKSVKASIQHTKEMQRLDIQRFGEKGRGMRQNSIDSDNNRIQKAEKEIEYYNSMLEVNREIYLYAVAYKYYAKDNDGITSEYTSIVTYNHEMKVIECIEL